MSSRVHNPDCLPFVIHSCDAAPTPSGPPQIVGDNVPILHAPDSVYFPLHRARDDHCRITYIFFASCLRRNTRSDKSPSQHGNNAVTDDWRNLSFLHLKSGTGANQNLIGSFTREYVLRESGRWGSRRELY